MLNLKLEWMRRFFQIGPAQLRVVFSAQSWNGEDKSTLTSLLRSWFNSQQPYLFGRRMTLLYQLYQRGSFILLNF
jgi:hypothetical protein